MLGPALTSTVGRRLALLDQLRGALDENQFVLHYQPILRMDDGPRRRAEALLRWNHPSDGLVPPAAFLPVLEETGLIVPVGCWVLRETVRQMQVWQMLYGRELLDWVSVNVSARQFNDPSILMATLAEIRDSGFPLSRLKIEITESAVMRNPAVTKGGADRAAGLARIAIDDFGTGCSALGALRDLELTIKIDRGFTMINRPTARAGAGDAQDRASTAPMLWPKSAEPWSSAISYGAIAAATLRNACSPSRWTAALAWRVRLTTWSRPATPPVLAGCARPRCRGLGDPVHLVQQVVQHLVGGVGHLGERPQEIVGARQLKQRLFALAAARRGDRHDRSRAG